MKDKWNDKSFVLKYRSSHTRISAAISNDNKLREDLRDFEDDNLKLLNQMDLSEFERRVCKLPLVEIRNQLTDQEALISLAQL